MIKTVQIKNFKSFRDVTLELRRNNVLLGPNMSGKSNFLDFFKFVQDLLVPSPGMLSGLANALNPRNGFRRVAWGGGDNSVIQFAIDGAAEDGGKRFDWRYEVELLGNQWGSAQIQRETLTVNNGDTSRALIETNGEFRNILGVAGAQVMQVRDSNKLALEYDVPNWEGNFLRRSIFSWRLYNLVPPLMRSQNPTAATEFLTSHGENLSAWLMVLQTKYSEYFERIRSVAKDVFPSLENIFTSPTAHTTVYLASNEKFLKEPVTVAEMSDGELTFLALLSLLYAPRSARSELCLIEEPENHLHPRLLAVFVDLLRQIQIEFPPEKHSQFVITTHSPYLVDRLSIDELILLNRQEGATVFQRPGDRAELRAMVSNEEIGLGDLYFSGALSLA